MNEEPIHRISHHRFGELDIPSSAVLRFDGLPGFDGIEQLALVDHDLHSPFAWLVSLDDPDLAFVVTEPRQFFVDYVPHPTPHQLRAIGIKPGDDYDLLTIATFRAGTVTLNLAAPILVNPSTHRATQAILEGERHPMRAELRPATTPQPPRSMAAPSPTQIESKPQR